MDYPKKNKPQTSALYEIVIHPDMRPVHLRQKLSTIILLSHLRLHNLLCNLPWLFLLLINMIREIVKHHPQTPYLSIC